MVKNNNTLKDDVYILFDNANALVNEFSKDMVSEEYVNEKLDHIKNCEQYIRNAVNNSNKSNNFEAEYNKLEEEYEKLYTKWQTAEKVVDKLLDSMEQNGIVCLFSGCPNEKYDFNEGVCVGDKCPTKEQLKAYFYDKVQNSKNN